MTFKKIGNLVAVNVVKYPEHGINAAILQEVLDRHAAIPGEAKGGKITVPEIFSEALGD